MVRVESWDIEKWACTGMVTLRTVRACGCVKGWKGVGLALKIAGPAHLPTVVKRVWLRMETVTRESSVSRWGGLVVSVIP